MKPPGLDTGWIYAVHRTDGSVAYVGQTIELPAVRFRSHARDALQGDDTPFHVWLLDRFEAGESPRVSTLERCSRDAMDERELFWIRRHHAEQAGGILNVAGIRERSRQRQAAGMGARAQRASERAERAAAEVRAIAVSVVGQMGDGPHHKLDVRFAISSVLRARLPGKEVSGQYAMDVALSLDFEARGSRVVRAGTLAAQLSDPRLAAEERVNRFLALAQSELRSVTLPTLCAATLVDRETCKSTLLAFGWTETSRHRWVCGDHRRLLCDVSAGPKVARLLSEAA